jgi:hypothetical protein
MRLATKRWERAYAYRSATEGVADPRDQARAAWLFRLQEALLRARGWARAMKCMEVACRRPATLAWPRSPAPATLASGLRHCLNRISRFSPCPSATSAFSLQPSTASLLVRCAGVRKARLRVLYAAGPSSLAAAGADPGREPPAATEDVALPWPELDLLDVLERLREDQAEQPGRGGRAAGEPATAVGQRGTATAERTSAAFAVLTAAVPGVDTSVPGVRHMVRECGTPCPRRDKPTCAQGRSYSRHRLRIHFPPSAALPIDPIPLTACMTWAQRLHSRHACMLRSPAAPLLATRAGRRGAAAAAWARMRRGAITRWIAAAAAGCRPTFTGAACRPSGRAYGWR